MWKENPLAGFIRSITQYRKDHGNMTQAEFAKFIGVHLSTVKRWETGMNGPKAEEILPIADKMGLTVDELLRGIKPENVSINRETGLSSEAIERLRHRDSVVSFYLTQIIEPLMLSEHTMCDVLRIAAIKRKYEGDEERNIPDSVRYEQAGIKWSILENYSKSIDKAVDLLARSDEHDETISNLLHAPKMISAYEDFGSVIREKQEGGNRENA